MFEQAIQLINNSKNIIIFTHISQDGDTLGSSYALRLILSGMGKGAFVMEDEPHKITQMLYGVQDNVPLEKYDLAIAIDCGDAERLGQRVAEYKSCPNKLVIDHHDTHINFGDIDVVDPSSAASAELIFILAKELNVQITPQIATNLHLALVSDTGGFMFANTSSQTMRIAAELLECGAEAVKINTAIFAKNSLIRLELMKMILNSLTVHSEGRIACIHLSESQMEQAGATSEDCDGLISLPRSLDTSDAAVFIKERKEGGVKISLRSNECVNVAEICAKHNGGGHKRAAGCNMDCDIETAKKIIVKELEEGLNGWHN